jgi:hypothetical protein
MLELGACDPELSAVDEKSYDTLAVAGSDLYRVAVYALFSAI